MRTRDEVLAMADQAKAAAGWEEDGSYRPIDVDTTGDSEAVVTAVADRHYAEGVEAGLRWAALHAGAPLPR